MITHFFDGKLIRFQVFLGDIMNCSNKYHLNTVPLIVVGFEIDFLIVKIALIFILHWNSEPLFQSYRMNFSSFRFFAQRCRSWARLFTFAVAITIMDRITLFDIEINTLFEFAYNLFFVCSVSFSKRLMNKATDDIQLWRKSE